MVRWSTRRARGFLHDAGFPRCVVARCRRRLAFFNAFETAARHWTVEFVILGAPLALTKMPG
jgi:hypothetical protein